MAKIYSLKISNFKGIQRFEQVFGLTDFICIIGRGDSGKTTILEAIAMVLSPSWNVTFYDTDFFNGDVNNSIEIEATLYDLPLSLLQENKYGLHKRFLNKKGEIIDNVLDDELDENTELLTIKLSVDKNLEPKWHIVTERVNQPFVEIRANDRASLNVFLVSDYIDRHFSWSKGNPLYSLLKGEDTNLEKSNIVIDAFREAKEKIDSNSFSHLDNVVKKIKLAASTLGVDINETNTTIDFRDISIKDGRICLHENTVPFRQKGKGSKRLISIAIQTELAKTGGILLIDEIEQGLEPDRAQHLAKILKSNNKGQVFITTHSRDVLVELMAQDIFRIKKGNKKLYSFDESLQACIRSNPEAFFSDRVLICEGPTEIGICRSLNEHRMSIGKDNVSFLGIRFANGNGSSQIGYAKSFLKAGYDVCLFCDSDVSEVNEQKEGLRNSGIVVVDCELENSSENQIFLDIPWDGIKELINYQITQLQESIEDSIKAAFKKHGELQENWIEKDTLQIRQVLGDTAKKKAWFKRTDHGEFLGAICCKYLENSKDKRIKKQIDELNKWMDNA